MQGKLNAYATTMMGNLKQTNDDEPDDIDDDCGFDPYLGFYTNDC